MFKITVPIQDCYIQKSIDEHGNEVDKRYITGLASGTELDRDTEKMAESALHAMREAIEVGILTEKGEVSQVPLYNEHRKETLAQLGWLTKAWLEKKSVGGRDVMELWVEAELDDDNPQSSQLYKKLTTPGPKNRPVQLGLSISGKVTKAYRQFDPSIKKAVTVFEHIALGEVSVVTKPAYAGSYLDILEKSYKEETGNEIPFHGEKSMEMNNTEAQNQTSDTENSSVSDTQNTEKATSNDSQTETLTLDAINKAFEPKFEDFGNQLKSLVNLIEEMKSVMRPAAVETTETVVDDSNKSVTEPTSESDINKGVDVDGVSVLKQAITEALAGNLSAIVEKMQKLEESIVALEKPVDKSFSVLGEGEQVVNKNQQYETLKNAAIAAGKDFDPIETALQLSLGKRVN